MPKRPRPVADPARCQCRNSSRRDARPGGWSAYRAQRSQPEQRNRSRSRGQGLEAGADSCSAMSRRRGRQRRERARSQVRPLLGRVASPRGIALVLPESSPAETSPRAPSDARPTGCRFAPRQVVAALDLRGCGVEHRTCRFARKPSSWSCGLAGDPKAASGPRVRRAGGAFVRSTPLTVRFRVEPSGGAST
jgi:hypothetical protein